VFYRWVNFVLLVGGLSVVLRKPLREFFSQRTSSVHKALEEGRQALEASAQRLYAVESRLAHFEEEMATFREKAVQEMAEERERLHRLTAEEGAKMMESVRAQLDTAFKAARLELRLYAAEQAVKLAGARIGESLDEAGHERLVARFVAGLDARKSQN
jgi:F0F1-type ATP synthase membrane subunit b/b'